jgi:preprotein translocase subunit SecE
MGDKLKLALAIVIVVLALGGFYVYAEQSLLLRVGALLTALIVASVIALRTETGAATWGFGRGALVEVRKVVWPTRQETIQTTLMVMAMVIVVGIILWIFDMLLAWGVQTMTGQG